jgi:small-conductance mechanosensitive channel
LLTAALPAVAQDAAGASERLIQTLRSDLQRIDAKLRSPSLNRNELAEERGALEEIRSQALAASLNLAVPIENIEQQIGRLGAPPVAPETEAPEIANQRATLQSSLSRLQSSRKQLDLIATEAEQASGTAASLQRDQFFSRVFEGSKSIINPSLWYDTAVGVSQLWQRLGRLFANWWTEVGGKASFIGLLIIPLGLIALYSIYTLLKQRIRNWFDPSLFAGREPEEIDRVWRVVKAVLAVAALFMVIYLIISLALDVSGMITPRFKLVLDAVFGVIADTTIMAILAQRLASPGLPAWRLIRVDEPTAVQFPLLFTLAAFVSSLTSELQTLTDALYLPVSSTVGQSAISAAVLLVLLALIMLALRNTENEDAALPDRNYYFSWMMSLRPLIWLLLAISALALLFGYIAFASYVVHQIFYTSVLLTGLFLVHHLSDAAVAAGLNPSTLFGRFLRRVGGLSEAGISRIGLISKTLVDVLLVIIGLPLLFIQWAVTWVDFRSLVNSAIFGFSVGNVTISLWSIVLIMVIVALGTFATRIVVRWLDARILANTNLDKGVRDSVKTAANYAGYILAGIFALTAAGLDFSNLAIIAGALGVGIGLGLQSIVNNFVSGLILLAERPIRSGDWISHSSGDGIVKRINVRSTSIETFDKSTIIIPNSLLVTEPVRNWTYGSGGGRFSITVNVEYGNDPEFICKVLTECANAHRAVLSEPPAVALLIGFGDLGMSFDMKGYVANVFEAGFVAHEIRIAVYRRFNEEGIRIPVLDGSPGAGRARRKKP